MNEKPFHLPVPFGEALERLARVPKSALPAKEKKKPGTRRASPTKGTGKSR